MKRVKFTLFIILWELIDNFELLNNKINNKQHKKGFFAKYLLIFAIFSLFIVYLLLWAFCQFDHKQLLSPHLVEGILDQTLIQVEVKRKATLGTTDILIKERIYLSVGDLITQLSILFYLPAKNLQNHFSQSDWMYLRMHLENAQHHFHSLKSTRSEL